MKSYQNILLTPTSTIKEALKIIDSGAMKLAIVIDEDEKLIGTLTDGDIRRGLLGDLTLNDSIETIIYKTPTVCNIEDTKEKILEVAIAKKLYQIPIVDNDGKLIGIEEVDELLKAKYKSNKVVLMVGGLGTRLYPLTKNTPKPMLILGVSYKSEIIENYFGDGSNFGVSIKYIHEEKRMGTAGALSLIRDELNEPFFVMNGDLLTNINFEHMMDYHIQNSSTATMGVREYDFQIPYGVVHVDGINIKSIEEKPVHNFYVSGGVYVLNPDSLRYIPQNEYFDMPTLFENIIANGKKSISFPIREYWLDIGRIEEFEKANNEYKEMF